MIVTPFPVSLSLPPSPVPRSRGTHVSGVIRCIATDLGILKPEWVDEPTMADMRSITDPVAVLRICIGLAWEEWYIGKFLAEQHGVVKHPGEMCLDGIYLSPDGESLDVMITPKGRTKHFTRMHEVKATYKSINTVAEMRDQWLWLTQIKCYCKAAGTQYARIHVLFLCGDYKMPITPQIKAWNLEFTQKELDSNWEMIREYRDWKEVS